MNANPPTGTWSELTLPVAVMMLCVAATWLLIRQTNLGRQLYAFGDSPEGARRAGVNLAAMQGLAFGWCGFMAGMAALMQVNIVQEVVPNALYGRELEVLAAVVLGGARLGGGKGSVTGLRSRRHVRGRHPERAEPPRRVAIRLQDDHRCRDPDRDLDLQHVVWARRRRTGKETAI